MNKTTVALLSVGAATAAVPGVASAAYNTVSSVEGKYAYGPGAGSNGDFNAATSSSTNTSISEINDNFSQVAQDFIKESTARDDADRALGGRIDQEIIDRKAGDAALQGNIDQESTARDAADKVLQKNIDDNKAAQDKVNDAQASTNSTLQNNIDNNKKAQDAVNTAQAATNDTLQSNIEQEIKDRKQADAETLNSAKDWASSEAKKAEENAETYTDGKVADTKKWAQGEISAQQEQIDAAKKAANGANEAITNERNERTIAITDERNEREKAITNERNERITQVSEVYENSKKYADNVGEKTLKQANEYTDVEIGKERYERIQGDKETLAAAKEHTNQKFSQLKSMIDKNKRQANAGISAALAASQIPQVSQGTDFSLGAGVGSYRGEQAMAIGISGRLNDRTVTRVAVTVDSTKNVGVGAGISYEW